MAYCVALPPRRYVNEKAAVAPQADAGPRASAHASAVPLPSLRPSLMMPMGNDAASAACLFSLVPSCSAQILLDEM